MPRKRKSKMYLVLAESNNYTQGAFPYTEEGKRMAEELVKKAARGQTREAFYITER